MKPKQIEVYRYYKQLYPEAIVLFHIGTNHVSIFEDAVAVAKTLIGNADGVTDKFEFPYGDTDSIMTLGESFQIHMVDYRNDDGVFDFPDIQRLQREKDEDY